MSLILPLVSELMRAKAHKPSANQDCEEKRISKQDKEDLDKAIAKESKQGWMVKSRSHEADGVQGVILFRKKEQWLLETQTGITKG